VLEKGSGALPSLKAVMLALSFFINTLLGLSATSATAKEIVVIIAISLRVHNGVSRSGLKSAILLTTDAENNKKRKIIVPSLSSLTSINKSKMRASEADKNITEAMNGIFTYRDSKTENKMIRKLPNAGGSHFKTTFRGINPLPQKTANKYETPAKIDETTIAMLLLVVGDESPKLIKPAKIASPNAPA
jgi:hypothetical protein